MATAEKTYSWGTGRRKTAVARVRIREGTGQYLVNGLEADAYFLVETERIAVRAPLFATEMGGRVDVFVNVMGSGNATFASDGDVDANIMGSGNVTVRGRARCNVKSMGSGKLVCEPGDQPHDKAA